MISAKELRLGNLINRKYWNPHPVNPSYFYDMCVVHVIKHDSINILLSDKSIIAKYPLVDASPITITSDILLRFGFEEGTVVISSITIVEKCYWLDNVFVLIRSEQNTFMGKRFYSKSFIDEVWAEVIFYLRQLQNLYFAITGKELEITF